MHPKLYKRLGLTGSQDVLFDSPERQDIVPSFSKTSVRDQAALLLSIADIARSELEQDGTDMLWEVEKPLPKFPALSNPNESEKVSLSPHPEPLWSVLSRAMSRDSEFPPSRLRTVSIDSPVRNCSTPVNETQSSSPMLLESSVITPIQSPRLRPVRKQSLRLSTKTKRHHKEHLVAETRSPSPPCSTPKKSRSLQGECPRGLLTKKIHRKKFSWKNYPELEQFLIANREEYLRHSAMNYTVQQKQYNNRLTDELLELATEHGYIFDVSEFNFVTVRDRIRCYYKSYVQSAKKRGILMGYAARKAGLLSDQDLEQSTNHPGEIALI